MVRKYLLAAQLIALALFWTQQAPCQENHYTPRPNPKRQALAREKPMLTLYYSPWCSYCQKVTDYLKQVHRTIPSKNLQLDSKAREELRKLGGKTQVPCLVINGKAMYESAAIIQWISQNKASLDPS